MIINAFLQCVSLLFGLTVSLGDDNLLQQVASCDVLQLHCHCRQLCVEDCESFVVCWQHYFQ